MTNADLLFSYIERRKTLGEIKPFLLLLVHLLPWQVAMYCCTRASAPEPLCRYCRLPLAPTCVGPCSGLGPRGCRIGSCRASTGTVTSATCCGLLPSSSSGRSGMLLSFAQYSRASSCAPSEMEKPVEVCLGEQHTYQRYFSKACTQW